MWAKVFLGLCLGWSAILLSMTFLCDSAPQTVNPYYCFYWMMAGLSGSVLLLTLLRRFQFRVTVSDVLVLAYVGYGLVHSLVLDSGAGTKMGILALFGVAYFCFRWILSFRKRAFLFLCVVLVATGLVQAWWGLSQLYGFSTSNHFLFKLTGSFYNPGPYSGYLALVLPLALYLMLRFRVAARVRWSGPRLFFSGIFYLSALTVFNILLVLPAGMSRSAWLGALVGSLWVLGAHYHWKEAVQRWVQSSRKRLVCALGMVLLVALLVGAGLYYLKKPSADGRLLVWKISAHVVGQHPLFGVGLGHFSGAYGEAQAAYFSTKGSEAEAWVSGTPEYAFNEYVQVAVELGLVGLLLFLFMLGRAFLNRSVPPGIIGALISLLVFALFSYPFQVLPFLVVMAFLLAAAGGTRWSLGLPRWMVLSLAFLFFLVSLGVWFERIPTQAAQKQYQDLKYVLNLSTPGAEDIEAWEKVYPLLSDQVPFLFDYGRALAEYGALEQSTEVFKRALAFRGDPMMCNLIGKNFQQNKEYDRAEQWLMKASFMGPNRLYPHYLLAKLYAESGQREKALDKAQFVVDKDPKVVSSATNEMKAEMRELLDSLRTTE